MKFLFRRRGQVHNKGLELARMARIDAEASLAHDTEHTIIPLDEVRKGNHVTALLNNLITERAKEIKDT